MLKTHRLKNKKLENETVDNNGNKVSFLGKTLIRSKDTRKSPHFEEEKQEIVSLPPVLSLEINENVKEGKGTHETQSNKDKY